MELLDHMNEASETNVHRESLVRSHSGGEWESSDNKGVASLLVFSLNDRTSLSVLRWYRSNDFECLISSWSPAVGTTGEEDGRLVTATSVSPSSRERAPNSSGTSDGSKVPFLEEERLGFFFKYSSYRIVLRVFSLGMLPDVWCVSWYANSCL